MKLTLGDNIRTFRRAMDMTQEQLAEQLGVSFQSVSRWENGTTYPDMELLPALARIFSVTVDALLGMSDEERQKNFEEIKKKLRNAVYAEEKDESAIVAVLREMRRDYSEFFCKDSYYFDDLRDSGAYRLPAVMEEMRMIFEYVQTHSSNNFAKCVFIQQMAELEDEEHLTEFLRRNATAIDLSGDALLRRRYGFRQETDKLEKLRQVQLYELIAKLCLERDTWAIRGEKGRYSVEYCKYISEVRLNLLHSLCNITPDPKHPVTGDGSLDLFVDFRLLIGAMYTAYCAGCGETERALTVMEDWIALFEKIMSAPDGQKLTCTSPAMDVFSPKMDSFWMPVRGHEERFGLLTDDGEHSYYALCSEEGYFYGEHYGLFDPSGYCGYFDPENAGFELFDPRWLDPIREEPRFKAALERLHALIETRELTES